MLIAVLIKLDSPGKVLFGQERIGRDGRHFVTWKFRTMVEDAELILEDWLKRDPILLKEWETTQKLKKDPRLTQVGRILRRLSLDELPQLYNILVGEMSLVGPRPILPEQQAAYGKAYNLYVKVRPGLTGMWQVSGRNSTTFEERAQWDDYYVRNWSDLAGYLYPAADRLGGDQARWCLLALSSNLNDRRLQYNAFGRLSFE